MRGFWADTRLSACKKRDWPRKVRDKRATKLAKVLKPPQWRVDSKKLPVRLGKQSTKGKKRVLGGKKREAVS